MSLEGVDAAGLKVAGLVIVDHVVNLAAVDVRLIADVQTEMQ
jgi:hypothetical protein